MSTISAGQLVRDPEFWRRRLGLLPVPLRDVTPTNDEGQRFVLLNGTVGNFCLQADGSDNSVEAQSSAWSTDVGHHVHVSGGFVRVTGWGSGGSNTPSPRYAVQDVAEHPEKFHQVLERNEPNREHSIVAHATRVLRMLRGCLPQNTSPEDTVRAFLELMRQGVRRQSEQLSTFEVSDDVARAPSRQSVSADEWEMLLREFTEERPLTQLRPYIELMLLHASGTLFQEVHYQAVVPYTRSLPGIAPPMASLRRRQAEGSQGVFFTPSAIARTLVEEALSTFGEQLPSRLRVFDPACGSAEFLKETVRQLTLRNWRGQLDLIGWDIMPSATSMAKFAMAFESARTLPFQMSITIETCDSLTQPHWPSDVQVLLMNPPFGALIQLTAEQRHTITQLVHTKSRPNMATAFLARAIESVGEGGVLASVLPASVLTTEAASSVREKVSVQFVPRLLARLGSMTAFAGALVDASLYIGKKIPTDRFPTRVVWADHRQESMSLALRSLRRQTADQVFNEAVDEESYSLYPADDVARNGNPWSVARYQAYMLAHRVGQSTRLGDIFEIKQGCRLGHDVFIQTADFVASLPPSERAYFRPAVINESLADSRVYSDYFVWYPYDGGGSLFQTEDQLRSTAPNFFEILVQHRDKLISRNRTDENNWWLLLEPRLSWQVLRAPKLVTKYFGKAGAVAYDKAGDFVTVVGHAWIPKETSKNRRPRLTDLVAHAYVALTASETFEQLLQTVAPSISGGQFNLENRYLKSLPMPDLLGNRSAENSKLVVELAQMGKALSEGGPPNPERLNALACEAFLNP